MNQRPELRRNGSFDSDTSSFYSVRSGDSAYSVWSSSESDSFVWRDDPEGFYGVGGAVTRYVDDRDDQRRRFAAHILSGPFAQFYKKKRHASSHARPGRSAHSSRSSSRSSTNSVSPGRGHHHHDPRFHSRPPSAGPQYPQEQFREEQFHEEQFQEEQFHEAPFHQPPFHPGFHGGPPPPPPPPPPPAAPAGFEGGFIQLGGPSGPPPPPPDPVWGHDAGYGPGVHVYD
ncbi:hypothetical protein F4815DRAFT_209631 [Daldinia loculata]|uniref:uncharacterized protein n=1 Tax=Daldinia loculata TaxID=103429 RepID=UPI0020C4283E|nr:uncharacterized protein F4817DRAFT_37355 [Daldinia loculata]KAI1649431.1 hypothetical protein F4817DRAFT_37355 [Daldinia loculata]KAI2784333.1 hypothetical protein F4815DRAFT_209631 [Daldinia loculata]